VAQQELDLLKLAARCATQLRAGPSQVMGCDTWNANLHRILPEHLPDDFLAQAITAHSIGTTHSPEDVAIRNSARRRPCIDRYLNP
jgi:hypothetical protein